MIFNIVRRSTGEPVRYENHRNNSGSLALAAKCQLEAQVEVRSIGLSWKPDPLETCRANFAVIGKEVVGGTMGDAIQASRRRGAHWCQVFLGARPNPRPS
jgi:hypothetical protein